MKYTLKQIAALLQAELEGDPEVEISQVAKIEQGVPGSISFLANPKYLPFIYETKASAVIVSRDFVPQQTIGAALLRVDDPYAAFTSLLEMATAAMAASQSGIEQPSFVHETAELSEDVYVGAFAYIAAGAKIGKGTRIYPNVYVGENAVIGAGSILYPNVSVYHHCRIGQNCILHAGTVIGSDGFGFAPQADGSFKKVPQTGIVVLEDEVEIGANSCIDRATMGETIIRRGAKLDNLVQLAHNVDIGQHTVIAAQTGIAGSTNLGENCMIGGQVGIVGHLNIANRTKIDAQSGVNRSIKEEGLAFRGSPIQVHRQQLKSEVVFRKLEDLYARIRQLEEALDTTK
ncbi:MAG: UDP-3-O-(3-hydroxymyristoyl)glucosamine N-acyltransferase [Bacteroidota bacterium]